MDHYLPKAWLNYFKKNVDLNDKTRLNFRII